MQDEQAFLARAALVDPLPVPSGEESSTMRMCAAGTCAQICSRIVGSVAISL